ncbi:hypothetical protein CC2G_005340 [Coprinopsis cinerea AmutBmut pab1-1]|nr:hypothetical protein CC2G_005340 [Coprinopsis cinerea AmutBmut pab1-1]
MASVSAGIPVPQWRSIVVQSVSQGTESNSLGKRWDGMLPSWQNDGPRRQMGIWCCDVFLDAIVLVRVRGEGSPTQSLMCHPYLRNDLNGPGPV